MLKRVAGLAMAKVLRHGLLSYYSGVQAGKPKR